MTLQEAVQGTQLLGAIASLVSASELHQVVIRGDLDAIWPERALRSTWGWRAGLFVNGGIRRVVWMQAASALALLAAALFPVVPHGVAPVATALLLICLWLTAHRVRGPFNGGSDGMLFTVLLGLLVAVLPAAPDRVHQGGMLYIAVQLALSYWRAGWVKARSREWYTGEALRAFLSIPAYGVPSWVPRRGGLLAVTGIIVVMSELTLPLLLLLPRGAPAFAAVAVAFHAGVSLLFGLNRFLLTWSAALPAAWYLHDLLHR